MREVARGPQSLQNLQSNPYVEIWDLNYFSSSDEEDNDSGKESEDDDSDSEVDSDEKKSEDEDEQDKKSAEESQNRKPTKGIRKGKSVN